MYANEDDPDSSAPFDDWRPPRYWDDEFARGRPEDVALDVFQCIRDTRHDNLSAADIKAKRAVDTVARLFECVEDAEDDKDAHDAAREALRVAEDDGGLVAMILAAQALKAAGLSPAGRDPASAPQAGEKASGPPKANPFHWRDPAAIPPRKFLYDRHAIRGFISVTAAIAGLGKTSLLLGESVAIGTGRDLFGITPRERVPVWYIGLEDPLEEYERRVAAIALRYGIPGEEIARSLFLDSGRDQNFIIATEERAGVKITEPVVDAIIANVRRHGIGQIVVDPFVACHSVSENDNTRLEKVTRAWAYIADRANCAVELVHHFRKSGSTEPTVDDVRGASAIVGAARSVRILAGMTKDQAEAAGVENRFRYFSVQPAKANLFPRGEGLDWIEMQSVGLGNGGGGPDDQIGVAVKWLWPNAFDGVEKSDLAKVQSKIAGGRWRENAQSSDWVGRAVAEALRLDLANKAHKAKVKALVRGWIEKGFLAIVEGKDEARRTRSYVEVGQVVPD